MDDNKYYPDHLISDTFNLVLPEYHSDFAGSTLEVFNRFKQIYYDIVITSSFLDSDYDGGLKLASKIKQKYPETKIVLLTGVQTPENELKKYGIDFFYDTNITKSNKIKNMIEKLLS